jgi:hypothetical protein
MKFNFTEAEFIKFIDAGYAGKELHPLQLQELKRAFYGGLTVAAFAKSEKDTIVKECKAFFEGEVKNHVGDKK